MLPDRSVALGIDCDDTRRACKGHSRAPPSDIRLADPIQNPAGLLLRPVMDARHSRHQERRWVRDRDMVRASSPRLRRVERWLERWLKLEHGANIFPLTHVAIYYAALALLLLPPVESFPALYWPLWFILVSANYSVSIGIIHLHGHRSLFTSHMANRLLEFLLCFPALHACATMRHVHVHLHHK